MTGQKVRPLAETIQQATQGSVELAWADQGYTEAHTAEKQGITLEILRLPHAK